VGGLGASGQVREAGSTEVEVTSIGRRHVTAAEGIGTRLQVSRRKGFATIAFRRRNIPTSSMRSESLPYRLAGTMASGTHRRLGSGVFVLEQGGNDEIMRHRYFYLLQYM